MARVEVPRSISEAPTDRLRVSVVIDEQERLVPGARAPTVGQGGGATQTRTPSAYLMGDRDESESTTLQIPMRAVVGTPVFDHFYASAKSDEKIDLFFRTYGLIRHKFPVKTLFELKTKGSSGGAKGLYEIAGKEASDYKKATLNLDRKGGVKPNLMVGSILEVVKYHKDWDKFTLRSTGFKKQPHNPEWILCSDILYDVNGDNPKAYAPGPTVIAVWPNQGADSPTTTATPTDHRVVCRDQSVEWTASGTVTRFEPGFGEDSALYTLDVTLMEAMPKAKIIYSADADKGNAHYS